MNKRDLEYMVLAAIDVQKLLRADSMDASNIQGQIEPTEKERMLLIALEVLQEKTLTMREELAEVFTMSFAGDPDPHDGRRDNFHLVVFRVMAGGEPSYVVEIGGASSTFSKKILLAAGYAVGWSTFEPA